MSSEPAAKRRRIAADGEPIFARLSSLAQVFLAFGSDFIARSEPSIENDSARDYYLKKLGESNPSAAQAYVKSQHCSVSFLTDTSTLQLLATVQGLSPADVLYNVVLGQTILADWRTLRAMGPFEASSPPTAEEFARKFRSMFPGRKAVVPSHLKQGVLSLLGAGPEIEACGRFIHGVAKKIPHCLSQLQQEDGGDKIDTIQVLRSTLKLPKFRALLVARILATDNPKLYDFESREMGDFAELGLWLALGMPTGAARAAVGRFKLAVDPLFKILIEELPGALQTGDPLGVMGRLEKSGIMPLCAQNVEHMLCEYRKIILPLGRPARRAPFDGYQSLWVAVAPLLLARLR